MDFWNCEVQEEVNSLSDVSIPAIFSFHPLPTLFPSSERDRVGECAMLHALCVFT
jgi:hypothetical protein